MQFHIEGDETIRTKSVIDYPGESEQNDVTLKQQASMLNDVSGLGNHQNLLKDTTVEMDPFLTVEAKSGHSIILGSNSKNNRKPSPEQTAALFKTISSIKENCL